jgi:riboflavin kinase/FMN adenylyltransferase
VKYSGVVQKGSGSGKRLGFPTANIPLSDPSISGIYAALVRVRGHEYGAAVYADTKRKLLEAHVLDFHANFYGETIEIELLKKLREDKVFANEEEAKLAIAKDVQNAADYHKVR